MPNKASAPRRKSKVPAVPRNQRGTRLSCSRRVGNTEKWSFLEPLFSRVEALKNTISTYGHAVGVHVIIDAYALKSCYKGFSSVDLNAWERQALFHDIVGDYQCSLQQRFKANPFYVHDGWTYGRYKRNGFKTLSDSAKVPIFKKDDLKPGIFLIRCRQTSLAALANYLLRSDTMTFDPLRMDEAHPLRGEFLRVQQEPNKWDRLLHLVVCRQRRLIASQKCIYYATGTFRVNPKESRTAVVVDETNKEHQLGLKLLLGVGKASKEVYLPLLSNKALLRTLAVGDISQLGFAKEFRLKLTAGRKLHVCTTYAAGTPEFLAQGEAPGLDLNTKRSLVGDSASRTYHIDQLLLEQGNALLDKIDAAGGVSKIGYRRTAQLKKWLKRDESSLKHKSARNATTYRAPTGRSKNYSRVKPAAVRATQTISRPII